MVVSSDGAMRALNSKGIVHRDLKPQNILLCHSGSKSVSSAADITLKIGKYFIVRKIQYLNKLSLQMCECVCCFVYFYVIIVITVIKCEMLNCKNYFFLC